jgi:hypothetical protein
LRKIASDISSLKGIQHSKFQLTSAEHMCLRSRISSARRISRPASA